MAFNPNEWFIHYGLKKIGNYDGSVGEVLPVNKGSDSSVGTVLQFFQWCASVFAQQTQMDDDYAFVSDTPNVYRFVNDWGFYYDASDYKYLSGGSIETSDASILYSNIYSIGSQTDGTQLYMIQGNLADAGATDDEVTPWWITGNIDILVEVKRDGQFYYTKNTNDVSTAGGVWVYAREFGDNYDHNFATLSGGGSTPVGINTALDISNRSGEASLGFSAESGTLAAGNFLYGVTSLAVGKVVSYSSPYAIVTAIRPGTGFIEGEDVSAFTDRERQTPADFVGTIEQDASVVSGYVDISTGFGTITRDLNNGAGLQSYDVEVNCATRTMSQVYEWLKYITRYTSSGALYTVNSDDGQEYRSAAEGSGEGATGGGPYTDVKSAPFGTLAGTTFFGARGVWVTNYASADFVLTDSTGTQQSPPNYQKVTATNTLLTGCQIFVAEITGAAGTIIKGQYAVDPTSPSGTDYINVTSSININKTPQSGGLRIDDNIYAYTAFDGSAFTGVTPNPSSIAIADVSLYVPLLDVLATTTTEQSDNIIYASNFDVRTVVRKYGFKPYTADTTFGSTGLSFSPILTSDPQAT